MAKKRKRKAKPCSCGGKCDPCKLATKADTEALKARASRLVKNKQGKLVSKRSKTQDAACSQAMSQWKTSGMTPTVAATLGKCRAKARLLREGATRREMGQEARAQAMESRANRGGPLTAKDRMARAKQLRSERASAPRNRAKLPEIEVSLQNGREATTFRTTRPWMERHGLTTAAEARSTALSRMKRAKELRAQRTARVASASPGATAGGMRGTVTNARPALSDTDRAQLRDYVGTRQASLLQRMRAARDETRIESGADKGRVSRKGLAKAREQYGVTKEAVADLRRRRATIAKQAASRGLDPKEVMATARAEGSTAERARRMANAGRPYLGVNDKYYASPTERAAAMRAPNPDVEIGRRAALLNRARQTNQDWLEAAAARRTAALAPTTRGSEHRKMKADQVRRERRAIEEVPSGSRYGNPILPTDLKKGDRNRIGQVVAQDGSNAQFRDLVTGGFIYRDGVFHPVRDSDALRRIRERRARRKSG